MSAHGISQAATPSRADTPDQLLVPRVDRGGAPDADRQGARAGLDPSTATLTASGSEGDAQDQDQDGLAHLEALRAELDATDAALLQFIRQRLDVCARIGLHKKRFAIPMMQPQRIGVVQARAAAFAHAHGLRPEFLHALYVRIIEETCRLEEEIIGKS